MTPETLYPEHPIDHRIAAARQRVRLQAELRAMTEAEVLDALFTDPVTGVNNRRAFDRGMSQVVAILDLDSLKWINDNEGHAAGDALLRELATELAVEFGKAHVYRIAGDEFAIRARSLPELVCRLNAVRARFPGFSYGIGRTLADADESLRFEKGVREARGLRAPRGERPPRRSDARAQAI